MRTLRNDYLPPDTAQLVLEAGDSIEVKAGEVAVTIVRGTEYRLTVVRKPEHGDGVR